MSESIEFSKEGVISCPGCTYHVGRGEKCCPHCDFYFLNRPSLLKLSIQERVAEMMLLGRMSAGPLTIARERIDGRLRELTDLPEDTVRELESWDGLIDTVSIDLSGLHYSQTLPHYFDRRPVAKSLYPQDIVAEMHFLKHLLRSEFETPPETIFARVFQLVGRQFPIVNFAQEFGRFVREAVKQSDVPSHLGRSV